jgi:acyl-coenzyme A synthetase/AMP-(fatty) acid ligase
LIVEGSQPNIDISALQVHPYEIPKDVILLPEFIRTETGKINRSKTKLLALGH